MPGPPGRVHGYSPLVMHGDMSWFSMWNHSEFRIFRHPVWSGLELGSSTIVTIEEKN